MRVLVADDDVDAGLTLGSLLEMYGHHVQVVHDGDAAVGVAVSFGAQALICDIAMPRVDGYEVARRIRHAAPSGPLMMIACTGFGAATDRTSALAAGFDHHLTKPLAIDELLQLLASGAGRPAAAQGS